MTQSEVDDAIVDEAKRLWYAESFTTRKPYGICYNVIKLIRDGWQPTDPALLVARQALKNTQPRTVGHSDGVFDQSPEIICAVEAIRLYKEQA